jgi:hypothetical protein
LVSAIPGTDKLPRDESFLCIPGAVDQSQIRQAPS